MEPIDLADVGAKASVGVVVSTYTYFGLPLSDWVAVFTLLYLACQVVVLTPKVIDTIRKYVRKIFNKE
jgi:hypothetical protein